MPFQPSPYSYGDASSPAPTSDSVSADMTQQYAQALRTFLGIEDPQVEAARVEAEIRNLQALVPTSVGPIRTYRLNQIAKLQAKLEVLRGKAAESQYASELTMLTRVAVTASSVIGTVIVLGGVALMGGLVWNQVQLARLRQEEIRKLRNL